MASTQDLFSQTTCYINGNPKNGKVLAVATYVDCRRICFQLEGENRGTWIPESALVGEEVGEEIVPSKIPIETPVETLNTAVKENPRLSDLKTQANPSAWKDLVGWLAGEFANIDFPASRNSVNRLQGRYKESTPYEIAHILIIHKSLQAAGVELISKTVVKDILIGLAKIDLPSISKLSAEMVYQIAEIYGFSLDSEERKQEALMIFGATLLGERAINAGIDWLKLDPMKAKVLTVTSKALMIYAIGNAACVFYAAKAKQHNALNSAAEFKKLEQESQVYLEDATSEDKIYHKLEEEIREAFPKPNYSNLEKLLSMQQWEKSDLETGKIVLQLLSHNPVDNISFIPAEDIQNIDKLWGSNSNGRFGFRVQKQIYFSVGKKVGDFGEAVGWRGKAGVFGGIFGWKEYKDLTFNLDKAPQGHLPAFWFNIYGKHGGVIVDESLKAILERQEW